MRTAAVASLAASLLFSLVACGPPDRSEGDIGMETPDDGGDDLFPEGGPLIGTVTIAGYDGGRQVRQGGAVFLDVTGEGLDAIQAGAVGLTDVSIVTQTPTALRVSFVVPHGAAAGDLDLVLSTTQDTATIQNVVTVTGITVSPAGSDGSGHGTTASPFRSLTRALAVVGAGDTIYLADGLYSAEDDENFARYAGWLPADVSLLGESREGTVIDGGKLYTFAGAGFSGGGEISNLTIKRGASAGVTAKTGGVEVANVRIEDCQLGVYAYGNAALRIRGSELVGNGDAALKAAGTTRVTIDSSVLEQAGGDAIVVDTSTGTPTIEIDGEPHR